MLSLTERAGHPRWWLALLATISLVLAALAVAAPTAAQDPPGNNGTVKVHDEFEPDPVVRNEPHVGCDFHFHFFFADAGQEGTWWIDHWPPPPGDMTTVMGPQPYGPTDADGEWVTEELSLTEGHYKLFWTGAPAGNSGNVNIKHKVFWVECPPPGGPTLFSANVPLLKVDQNGAGRAGGVFTLTGVSGTTFSGTATTTGNGSASFGTLAPGSYSLTETTAPTGCTGFSGAIAINVASNGTVSLGTPLPTGVTFTNGTLRVVNTCQQGLLPSNGGPVRGGALAGGGAPALGALPDTAMPSHSTSDLPTALIALVVLGALTAAGVATFSKERADS